MTDIWYETVESELSLTQGDFIFECPLINWVCASVPLKKLDEIGEVLRGMTSSILVDTVVMTQACDLEQQKVRNVVLCPVVPLSTYRPGWEAGMQRQGQKPTAKAWKRYCNELANGYVWNSAILNPNSDGNMPKEHLVVDFSEIHTIPRTFLESLLILRGKVRPRLLPPYREHLSQAFARYFMRVGLPVPIEKIW